MWYHSGLNDPGMVQQQEFGTCSGDIACCRRLASLSGNKASIALNLVEVELGNIAFLVKRFSDAFFAKKKKSVSNRICLRRK